MEATRKVLFHCFVEAVASSPTVAGSFMNLDSDHNGDDDGDASNGQVGSDGENNGSDAKNATTAAVGVGLLSGETDDDIF